MATTVNFKLKQLRSTSKICAAPANSAWSAPSTARSNRGFSELARAQSLLTAYSAGPAPEVVRSKPARGAMGISG